MTAIAHVGHGYWGRNLARNFSEIGVLRTIVDADAAVARAAADIYGVGAASFEQVLTDAAIDGVSLASPASMHFEQAHLALDAGKHVFVEKPLSLDVEQAELLCQIAEQRGLVLMVGHLMRYHPIYQRIKAMVSRGELGKLHYVYSNRQSLGKFRNEENVLWSFAPHDISMLLDLAGELPQQMSAQGSMAFKPGIPDMVTLQMRFANGLGAHAQVCWMHPVKEQRLVVMAEEGMVVFDDSVFEWADKLVLYRHRFDRGGPVAVPLKAAPEKIDVPRVEPLRQECLQFVHSITTRTRPPTDGREGLAVLRVLAEAQQHLDLWFSNADTRRLNV